jgi:hypothetical protein
MPLKAIHDPRPRTAEEFVIALRTWLTCRFGNRDLFEVIHEAPKTFVDKIVQAFRM